MQINQIKIAEKLNKIALSFANAVQKLGIAISVQL